MKGEDILLNIAKIAIDGTSFYFDREFDYIIPDRLVQTLRPMMRVSVPFGRGDKHRQGIVTEITQLQKSDNPLKEVYAIIDDKLCDDEWRQLIDYLKETTFCTRYDAVKAILPSALGVKINEYFRLGNDPDFELTDLQHRILEFLQQNGGKVSAQKLCKGLSITKTNRD